MNSLTTIQAENNRQWVVQVNHFVGEPARRCQDCGGVEFGLVEGSEDDFGGPTLACSGCSPAVAAVLVAVRSGGRLRWQAKGGERDTGEGKAIAGGEGESALAEPLAVWDESGRLVESLADYKTDRAASPQRIPLWVPETLPTGWRPSTHFIDPRPKMPFGEPTAWCPAYGHRRGWQSVFDGRWLCEVCSPPVSENVVRARREA